jgi:hypothetical protein
VDRTDLTLSRDFHGPAFRESGSPVCVHETPGSRADRVGQQATLRTASTGMSGRIPISSGELL